MADLGCGRERLELEVGGLIDRVEKAEGAGERKGLGV
jgi:hypothetical protein